MRTFIEVVAESGVYDGIDSAVGVRHEYGEELVMSVPVWQLQRYTYNTISIITVRIPRCYFRIINIFRLRMFHRMCLDGISKGVLYAKTRVSI